MEFLPLNDGEIFMTVVVTVLSIEREHEREFSVLVLIENCVHDHSS